MLFHATKNSTGSMCFSIKEDDIINQDLRTGNNDKKMRKKICIISIVFHWMLKQLSS